MIILLALTCLIGIAVAYIVPLKMAAHYGKTKERNETINMAIESPEEFDLWVTEIRAKAAHDKLTHTTKQVESLKSHLPDNILLVPA